MALISDRAAADLATYAPEQIGRTRYRTPEGFLVCEGVRIARTGPMMYAPDEMPEIEQGPFTAMITVIRDAEVLFAPDTILSFSGKPVTNDHPPSPVTPENYKAYSVGTVLNPRRGEGVETDYLLADLLITDAETIADIEAGKCEISAGYEVEVEQIKPGIARQTKNLGNHVALVDRARGGPALSIQDSEEPAMATRKTRNILDGIRKAFRAKDEAALEKELEKAEEVMDDEEDGDGDEATHRVVIEVKGPGAEASEGEANDDGEGEGAGADPYEARFKALEDCVGQMKDALEAFTSGMSGQAADGDGDEDDKEKKEGEGEQASDEDPESKEEEKEADKTTAQDAMSKAEILAPGIKLPVQDSAKGGVKRAAITDLRRRALKTVLADSARAVHIKTVIGDRDLDKMRPGEIAMAFDASAAVMKTVNNSGAGVRRFDVPQGPMTAAKLQERIQERRKAARGG